MNKYNKEYLKKNLLLCIGLYVGLNGLLVIDAITAKNSTNVILGKLLYFLPLLLLCLLFILMAYNGFKKSVKREEKKHNVRFSAEGEVLIDKKHMTYYNPEWLIFAGREVIHFGSIVEITDPFGGTDLKIVGSKYRAVVVTDKNKKYTIGSADPMTLTGLKKAYTEFMEKTL